MFGHHVLSDTIAVQLKLKLPRQRMLLQTVAGYQCTRYLETACLTGFSECCEDCSNTCLKFINDWTVGMYFRTVTSTTK